MIVVRPESAAADEVYKADLQSCHLVCLMARSVCVCAPCVQTLKINPEKKEIDSFVFDDFELLGYSPHKKIDMKMAV